MEQIAHQTVRSYRRKSYGINAGTWFVRKPYSTYSYAAVRRRGKQKTNGRIIIKIFPNGQLGSETENLEQLQAGVIAMTKVSAPGLATYNDAYNTFGLPYIFSNIDEFYKIMDSDKMQDFFLSSEDDEFVTLTYLHQAPVHSTQKISLYVSQRILKE